MKIFDSYSVLEVINAITKASSLANVLTILECHDNNNNRNKLKNIIDTYNVSTEHFKVRKPVIHKEDYENNPKLCKYCSLPIPWNKKDNIFCSNSCSASFNNKGIARNLKGFTKSSKIENIDDNIFIEYVNSSNTWMDLGNKLGYLNSLNAKAKLKIIEKCKSLNIEFKPLTVELVKDKTKGELFSNAKNWLSARTSIRKDADRVFKNSGKEYKCIVCGYNKHIEIAHIKAVSDFEDSTLVSVINDPNNLTSLCPNHHWEYDNNLLDLKEYL